MYICQDFYNILWFFQVLIFDDHNFFFMMKPRDALLYVITFFGYWNGFARLILFS